MVVAIIADTITNMTLFNFIIEQGLWLPVLLLILAGVCNGVMDSIAHHNTFAKDESDKGFWTIKAMAQNKYDKDLKRKKWFNIIPVWNGFLDGWHLSKSIMLWSISLAVSYLAFKGWDIAVSTLIIRAAFAAGFHFSYR